MGIKEVSWLAYAGKAVVVSKMKHFSWVSCNRSIINRLLFLRWANFERKLSCSCVPSKPHLETREIGGREGLARSPPLKRWTVPMNKVPSPNVQAKWSCRGKERALTAGKGNLWVWWGYLTGLWFFLKLLYPNYPWEVASLGEHMLLQGRLCYAPPPAESQPWVCCASHVACWYRMVRGTLPALSQICNNSSWV